MPDPVKLAGSRISPLPERTYTVSPPTPEPSWICQRLLARETAGPPQLVKGFYRLPNVITALGQVRAYFVPAEGFFDRQAGSADSPLKSGFFTGTLGKAYSWRPKKEESYERQPDQAE